ncbi:MAG: 16S rRNA (cytosine(1402)-N(4))-methyltransferase [Candidatus Paceibacterota bacterium]
MTSQHIPVLLQEVIESLQPKPGQFFVDGTVGGGGHTLHLFKRLVPGGTFLGLDRDCASLEAFKSAVNLKTFDMERVVLMCENYSHLYQLLAEADLPKANGILLDLGISSLQLGNAQSQPRDVAESSAGASTLELLQKDSIKEAPVAELSIPGFSFQRDEELRMTYEEDSKPVWKILQELSVKELARIIADYSQERFALDIASSIKQSRIKTTFDLVSAIERAVPKSYEQGRIHPATRTFMALRIYANAELEHLETFLAELSSCVAPKGRVAIITFHSLEDALVKKYFRELVRKKEFVFPIEEIVYPSLAEIDSNPRSRSAKLRVIEKI